MGILNSGKDSIFMEKVSVLVRPTSQFQDQECKIAPTEEIKVPSLDAQRNGKEEKGGTDELKSPVSLDHRIPVMLKCPPAPRKPKSLPSVKRKEILRKKILLDMTKEIDSLFPAAVLADLGNKIKKVRQGSDFIKCRI